MSLTKRLRPNASDVLTDITLNLPTLQFESALTKEQKSLLHLRARSHAISVSLCAQATFFVDILNEGRQLRKQLKSPQKRSTRLLQDMTSRDPLIVGILGCGHIGSQIAQCLLTYGRVSPTELHISTRRPETLEVFQSKGVDCYFDNVRLVSSVHVIFLCVLPSQVAAVAEEIKDHLVSSSVIFCTSSSTPTRKLKQILEMSNIIRPKVQVDTLNIYSDYDYSKKVTTMLENKNVVEQTNPFTDYIKDLMLIPSREFGSALLHCFVNTCLENGLTETESLEALHWVVFGETDKEPLTDRLSTTDLGSSPTEAHGKLTQFDLVEIQESSPRLLSKMQDSLELREAFSKRYWEVFEQYIHLTAYGPM